MNQFNVSNFLDFIFTSDHPAVADWGKRALLYEVGKILLDQGKSVVFMPDPERFQAYVKFCNKVNVRRQNEAQKKIYFWWISICNSGKRGDRFAEQSYTSSLTGR